MPPLGLITVAALCPKQWEIRLVDLAFEELNDEDLLWADLVVVSAMQVQRDDVRDTLQRASKLGRRTMVWNTSFGSIIQQGLCSKNPIPAA